MRTSALCVCFTAAPLVAGADPNRVMFPFRMPETAQMTKNHKVSVTGEKNFQHTCFDFVYGVAKLDFDSQKNRTMSEHISSFCTMSSPGHCEKWSDDLAKVLQLKKLKTKMSTEPGPRTYAQWCEEVFSTPESGAPVKLHVMGENEIKRQPKHQVHEMEQPKQNVHRDTAKVSLKHHSVKDTTIKQHAEEEANKLEDCVCNTRDGHEICRCAGNVKTVDGVLSTPKFSAASVETKIEGYEIEEIAQKFNAAGSKVSSSLDSAIDSLDKAFSASHRLK